MSLSAVEKIDLANIGLMIISCCVAMVIPFELFLFSYAILGPLHYLTEISWLHDRKYFAKGKYDGLVLVIIGLIATVTYFNSKLDLGLALPDKLDVHLMYIAFLSALIFVLVKSNVARIGGIILLIITAQLSEHFWLFFVVFLPTLIHVYIFTGLFMLFGALKSKSRFGLLSVAALVILPTLLFIVYPNTNFFGPSGYGVNAYIDFKMVNLFSLKNFMGVPAQPSIQAWDAVIFHSQTGVLFMRFVAFAYTYHYLNWFSKTEVIKWHKIPKTRLLGIALIWLVSICIYMKDYQLGLQWLFFLSFLHVFLEFPLNYMSAIGIGKSIRERVGKQGQAAT